LADNGAEIPYLAPVQLTDMDSAREWLRGRLPSGSASTKIERASPPFPEALERLRANQSIVTWPPSDEETIEALCALVSQVPRWRLATGPDDGSGYRQTVVSFLKASGFDNVQIVSWVADRAFWMEFRNLPEGDITGQALDQAWACAHRTNYREALRLAQRAKDAGDQGAQLLLGYLALTEPTHPVMADCDGIRAACGMLDTYKGKTGRTAALAMMLMYSALRSCNNTDGFYLQSGRPGPSGVIPAEYLQLAVKAGCEQCGEEVFAPSIAAWLDRTPKEGTQPIVLPADTFRSLAEGAFRSRSPHAASYWYCMGDDRSPGRELPEYVEAACMAYELNNSSEWKSHKSVLTQETPKGKPPLVGNDNPEETFFNTGDEYSSAARRGIVSAGFAAVRWYSRAIEAGRVLATFRLAAMFDEGDIVQRDPQRAYDLYAALAKASANTDGEEAVSAGTDARVEAARLVLVDSAVGMSESEAIDIIVKSSTPGYKPMVTDTANLVRGLLIMRTAKPGQEAFRDAAKRAFEFWRLSLDDKRCRYQMASTALRFWPASEYRSMTPFERKFLGIAIGQLQIALVQGAKDHDLALTLVKANAPEDSICLGLQFFANWLENHPMGREFREHWERRAPKVAIDPGTANCSAAAIQALNDAKAPEDRLAEEIANANRDPEFPSKCPSCGAMARTWRDHLVVCPRANPNYGKVQLMNPAEGMRLTP
jgi:TPR repeat protein